MPNTKREGKKKSTHTKKKRKTERKRREKGGKRGEAVVWCVIGWGGEGRGTESEGARKRMGGDALI